jgi:hypothetical protein
MLRFVEDWIVVEKYNWTEGIRPNGNGLGELARSDFLVLVSSVVKISLSSWYREGISGMKVL